MQKRIRLVIDILMTLLFIVLMGYHITGSKVHEILGVLAFILFIIHNILNIRWYKTIFKGKFSFRRIFQVVVNLSLLISFICMMVSGIMISSHVFAFLGVKTTMLGRNLHLISTSWGFVLMSIHVGFHLKLMLIKLNKKMKESTFEYIYYLLLIVLTVYGLYTFISTELWKDMFLVSQFKFFNYDQHPFLFYIEETSIICFISLITYLVLEVISKKRNR